MSDEDSKIIKGVIRNSSNMDAYAIGHQIAP